MEINEFQNGNSLNGNVIYTSGVRLITADEFTECIKCGHDEHKAKALRLPAPTIPKPGYIFCPLCGPDAYRAADWNPTHQEEKRRLEAEIRDAFFEDTRRGIKGGGSGGSGRRRERKPGEKFTVRFEQEWQGFINTNSAPEAITNITRRIEKTDVHLNLLVPTSLRDELMSAAKDRGTAASIVLRAAFADHLGEIEAVTKQVRGMKKERIRHCVSKGEKRQLEMETERHGCSLNELATECLTLYFYRSP